MTTWIFYTGVGKSCCYYALKGGENFSITVEMSEQTGLLSKTHSYTRVFDGDYTAEW